MNDADLNTSSVLSKFIGIYSVNMEYDSFLGSEEKSKKKNLSEIF